ncbi:MAG TPA: aspartate aminotransferase family protein [Candidatus Nanopelagicaceae bacterium]|nr:aspartate aminotransferase family protein [Candidatus Nanopelagicaceae bacterium]
MARPKVVLPENGIPEENLLKKMEKIREDDINWKDGKVWSLVYHASEKHTEMLKKAFTMFFSKNALSPMAFPSLKQFETEVISMAVDLFGGDNRCCGSMTSGGTESLLMAVKTYRDWAREKFPHIKEPEMVVPSSAHPSFDKAADYFGVKIVKVPVDKETHRADVKAMENALTKNTILMVGSACDFPRGVVDPISELASIAHERGIGMHVDACLGGFMLPFVKKLGNNVPDFDFSVPGVTSLSADVHKYGYGAKGASTILYRRERVWKHQFSVYTDWSGGIYISPSMRGTRPGGPIAAAWASMKALGNDGYLHLAKIVMQATKELIDGINQIPELYIIGDPVMSVFSFTSDSVDIYNLGDIMDKKGWHLDRIQFPNALHMMVNPHHARIVDTFLKDLKEAVKEIKEHPEASSEGDAAIYGMVASLPDRNKVKEYITNFLKSQYKIK